MYCSGGTIGFRATCTIEPPKLARAPGFSCLFVQHTASSLERESATLLA